MEIFIITHVDYVIMNSLMNLHKSIVLETKLWMISFKYSCTFIAYFLKATKPQTKNYWIGFHISSLFLKGKLSIIKSYLIHKIHI
jgi:hypothetical protein